MLSADTDTDSVGRCGKPGSRSAVAGDMNRTTTALVLAGGGVGGIAWELGVLQGLADADPALAAAVLAADTVIGTSAGSAVAAQITSGTPLADLYAAQLRPETAEIDPHVGPVEYAARLAPAYAGAPDAATTRNRIGAIALSADTVAADERLRAIRGRLPSLRWPDRDLRLPAVDAATGDRVVFDRRSGVPLLLAVAASCAVPAIWPPVSIDGHRYIDGGVFSGSNADLAADAGTVLVITPALPGAPVFTGRELSGELDELTRGGSRVCVVYGDAAAVAAFGADSLSPATRAPAAAAGRTTGRRLAAQVAESWRG